jgi:hypothetical protein
VRSVWRAVLVGTTVLSLIVAVFDIVDVLAFGTMPSVHRVIRGEVNTVIVSALITWHLGWKVWP